MEQERIMRKWQTKKIIVTDEKGVVIFSTFFGKGHDPDYALKKAMEEFLAAKSIGHRPSLIFEDLEIS